MSFKVISGASQAKLMPLDGGCEIGGCTVRMKLKVDDVGCIEAGPLSPGFFVAKKGDKPFTYAYKVCRHPSYLTLVQRVQVHC